MKSWRSLDQSKWVAVVLVGAIALAADVWLAVVTSRWGVAVTPDSIGYFQNALKLTASEMAASVRLTNWHAPLYPAVLAGPIALGFDATDAARLLNLVLFPANVALVGFILARLTCSAVAAALGATLTATAQVVLGVHAHAWTEPLFMFFGLLGLYQLGAYAVRGAEWRYWVGLVSLTLACLTRYAGIALLLAGAFGVWLWVPSRRRFLRCAGLLVLGVAPTVLWGLLRGSSSGDALFAGRGLVWHPITREQLSRAFELVELVLPERFASPATFALVLALACALLVGLLFGWPTRLRDAIGDDRRRILGFYALFLAIYPLFLATSISVYDASSDLGPRLLRFVLYPSGLIVAVSVAWRLLLGRGRIVTVTAAAAFCLLVAMHIRRTVAWSKHYLAVGEGYSGKAWRESGAIRRLRELGNAAGYYSNDPGAIWFLAGGTAYPIPRKANPVSRRVNESFEAESARLLERMEAEGALLVYLRGTQRWYLPSEQELAGQLGLELIEDLGDGAFYRAPTHRAADSRAEVSRP
jgi:hypothetical protein